MIIICVIATATAAAFAVTLLSVRTADAFCALSLFSDYIENHRSENHQKNSDDNKVLHNYLLRAYSAFIFLLVLIIRPVITPAKTRTAARPAKVAPMSRAAGAVNNVPRV